MAPLVNHSVQNSSLNVLCATENNNLVGNPAIVEPEDFTEFLKVNWAWFVTNCPKNNLPKHEAHIIALRCNSAMQFETNFANISEITSVTSFDKAVMEMKNES